VRILAIHFWDTRPELRDFWPKNFPVWEHNFEVMGRDLRWDVEHVVFLNWVADRPCVLNWLYRRGIRYERWDKRLSNRGQDHLVAFNKVAAEAYARIDFDGVDLVFSCTQDFVLVNHYDTSFFEVMYALMEPEGHPRNKKLGLYYYGACNYVSCATKPGAPASRYRHNGACSVGMYKIKELQYVMQSVNQTDMASECYLAHRLHKHCVYQQVIPEFYFGEYQVSKEEREGEWGEMVVAYARDPHQTWKMRKWER